MSQVNLKINTLQLISQDCSSHILGLKGSGFATFAFNGSIKREYVNETLKHSMNRFKFSTFCHLVNDFAQFFDALHVTKNTIINSKAKILCESILTVKTLNYKNVLVFLGQSGRVMFLFLLEVQRFWRRCINFCLSLQGRINAGSKFSLLLFHTGNLKLLLFQETSRQNMFQWDRCDN